MIKRVLLHAVMLFPQHNSAEGRISFLGALHHSGCVKYRMATRRMSMIPHKVGVCHKCIDFCVWLCLFLESCFSLHKLSLMSIPMVSIWRKSDQWSKRYDQKSVAACSDVVFPS
jgi:hypothetical protein